MPCIIALCVSVDLGFYLPDVDLCRFYTVSPLFCFGGISNLSLA